MIQHSCVQVTCASADHHHYVPELLAVSSHCCSAQLAVALVVLAQLSCAPRLKQLIHISLFYCNCLQNFIKRCGAYICSLSWEAYVKQGRGAVYANYDGGKAAGTLSEAEEKLGGIPCTLKYIIIYKLLRTNCYTLSGVSTCISLSCALTLLTLSTLQRVCEGMQTCNAITVNLRVCINSCSSYMYKCQTQVHLYSTALVYTTLAKQISLTTLRVFYIQLLFY